MRLSVRPTGKNEHAGTSLPRNEVKSELDPARVEHERQVREARLDLARRKSNWTEIPEVRLVRRGPFLVDAETDFLWTFRRGHVFEPHRASVGYVTNDTPMTYFVDQADNVVFLEPPSGPRTWSEIVTRRTRRRARA
ncbi:MAG TPA: hypothetical protein VM198_00240 [Longimicrobiales bacterium]|nr:hypothetical protein [Longimicrobiales bacterium]